MKNRTESDAGNKTKSGFLTAGIMGICLVLSFIFGFSLPEISDEPEGLLVDFGTDLTGFGLTEPDNNVATGGSTAQQVVVEENITQDVEESVAITDKKEIVKPKVNPVTTPSTKTNTTPATQINKDELFDPSKINTKGDKGTSEGTSTKGGNQGDPNGDPNGYQGKGSGIGDDGTVGYNLNGRKNVSPAILRVDHNEIGDIRIKIYVDRNGKVTKAEYERSGSTITDTYLISQAKNAAIKATFNSDSKASETQIGYITFHFKLQ